MIKRLMFMVVLFMIVCMAAAPVAVHAGGDKNTNRGSEGQQIGEPAPEPEQDSDQSRAGDPNPDKENVPSK